MRRTGPSFHGNIGAMRAVSYGEAMDVLMRCRCVCVSVCECPFYAASRTWCKHMSCSWQAELPCVCLCVCVCVCVCVCMYLHSVCAYCLCAVSLLGEDDLLDNRVHVHRLIN